MVSLGLLIAQFFSGFGFETAYSLCCWNSQSVTNWITQLGTVIEEPEFFYRYSLRIFNFTGMRFLQMMYQNVGMSSVGFGTIYIKSHKLYLEQAIRRMYTPSAVICPNGFYCFNKIGYSEIKTSIITGRTHSFSPQRCFEGAYCPTGLGIKLCPKGYYCAEGSGAPVQATPGSYSPQEGLSAAIECYAGSFTRIYGAIQCELCPNGFHCIQKGTFNPEICEVGEYRSMAESSVCFLCPQGTITSERGVSDKANCLPCPEGRVCQTEGLHNITQSKPCNSGKVCAVASTADKFEDCPAGFYCPENIYPDTKYNYKCPAGFYCSTGTSESAKKNFKCPEGFYCPSATNLYAEFLNSTALDYFNGALTRCPNGTQAVQSIQAMTSLTECVIDPLFQQFKTATTRSILERLL